MSTVTRVAIPEVMRFMTDALMAAGASKQAAEQQADLLLMADLMGHPSHGLNRLEIYISDILSGACQPNNQPVILKETCSTAWVDGMNSLGATVSHFAMDIAIQKAAYTGVGWVAAKGSNHNGMAGYWSYKAACQGFIGISATNTSPLCVPTRAKISCLGTNPLSVVAPAWDNDSFYLDMATTAVAVGKIEMLRRKKAPLPSGWALGPDGKETTDAEIAFKAKKLLPLGGTEQNSGFKGFGLAAMVDVLTGITAGSKFGHTIRQWAPASKATGPADLGHLFVAVDPNCFAPGFKQRLSCSLNFWRHMEPADPKLPVLAPGDKEKKALQEHEKMGVLTFIEQQIESSAKLAEKLKIKPLQVFDKSKKLDSRPVS